MNTTKTLHAVLIGINNYPSNPLAGCINDVLAINDHFKKLCKAQEVEIQWQPKFLLAPLESEKEILQEKGIEYTRPSRQNIIDAFDHFQNADAEQGDYCLLYYSGHGSYISTEKMPLFEEYDLSGEMQILVCLDENKKAETLHHLLDKELGYLIAKTLKEKKQSDDDAKNVHFLSIMDCCHSGTNTRGKIKERMHSGTGVVTPKVPLGFTKTGNCFYRPFKEGQKKVQLDGLTSARYISLAGSQSSESAYEMPLALMAKEDKFNGVQHGIFTVSLLKTLEQSGTNISYGELMQRVRMEVRSRIDKQIPHLDTMMLEDTDLYFLRNQFSPPKQEYTVAFRQKPNNEWILGAGAIQGIIPSNGSQTTTFQLNDETERIIEIKEVRATESLLNSTAFTEADKTNQLLQATIHEMTFPMSTIAFGKELSKEMRTQIKTAWKDKAPTYLKRVKAKQPHQFEINPIQNEDGSESFILTRRAGDVPLFERHNNAHVFLRDAEKVARYESILLMDNPSSTIPREDFEIKVQVLEGVPFDAETLNSIPDEQFKKLPINPTEVNVGIKIIMDESVQPAIKVNITCKNYNKVFWIGALYCDAQFGITDQYLQVQQIGKYQTDNVNLEFRFEDNGSVHKYQAIPLMIAEEWEKLGITEIQDRIIIFISDAQQPFSLEKFNQDKIELNAKRDIGFRSKNKPKKDSWRTIHIPIKISIN